MLRYGGGILDRLTDDDRALLFEVAVREMYAHGDTILREGESGGDVFVLVSGHREVDVNGDQVATMGPGQLFGEIGALTGSVRTATVEAAESCEVLRLGPDCLAEAMSRSPAFTNFLLRTLAVRTKTISDREVESRREHRELEQVERAMLPGSEVMDGSPRFRHEVRWRPFSYASGDYCDVIALDGGRYVIALGDVLGHGAQTSPTVGAVRSHLRDLVTQGRSPAEILPQLDRHLFRHGPAGLHVTLVVAVLDDERSTMRFATAGHPLPVLFRNGEAHPIDVTPGPLLGYDLAREREYEEAEVALEAGDRVLLYTDGLSEVRLTEEHEDLLLGEEGVARLFQAACRDAANVTGASVLDGIENADDLRLADDDLTMLLVDVTPND